MVLNMIIPIFDPSNYIAPFYVKKLGKVHVAFNNYIISGESSIQPM